MKISVEFDFLARKTEMTENSKLTSRAGNLKLHRSGAPKRC